MKRNEPKELVEAIRKLIKATEEDPWYVKIANTVFAGMAKLTLGKSVVAAITVLALIWMLVQARG